MTFPLRLQGRYVQYYATPRVSAFPQTNYEHASWNSEVFDGAREGEGVRRDDAHVGVDIDEALLVELLGIDDVELMLVKSRTRRRSARRRSSSAVGDDAFIVRPD
jgi:hypothetical protein